MYVLKYLHILPLILLPKIRRACEKFNIFMQRFLIASSIRFVTIFHKPIKNCCFTIQQYFLKCVLFFSQLLIIYLGQHSSTLIIHRVYHLIISVFNISCNDKY